MSESLQELCSLAIDRGWIDKWRKEYSEQYYHVVFIYIGPVTIKLTNQSIELLEEEVADLLGIKESLLRNKESDDDSED